MAIIKGAKMKETIKIYIRKILCKFNVHFEQDWSYDPYAGTYTCAYCGKVKD